MTIDSELTELEDLILRIVGAANDRGISKKNIGDMVNLIAQEANKAYEKGREDERLEWHEAAARVDPEVIKARAALTADKEQAE